jgi:hypothetical protein
LQETKDDKSKRDRFAAFGTCFYDEYSFNTIQCQQDRNTSKHILRR